VQQRIGSVDEPAVLKFVMRWYHDVSTRAIGINQAPSSSIEGVDSTDGLPSNDPFGISIEIESFETGDLRVQRARVHDDDAERRWLIDHLDDGAVCGSHHIIIGCGARLELNCVRRNGAARTKIHNGFQQR